MEMAVSVSLMAVIALALSGVLHSGLRALGAAKARAQGNDITTQGIEDLQRYGFNELGLCGTHTPSTPPAGLGDLNMLPNCPAAAALPAYDCNSAVGTSVPLAQYNCSRNNIQYTVRRYVAWGDALRTTKRLAVYVEWTDLVGRHVVSQQSSLRSPDQAAIVGLEPPRFTTPLPSATTAPTTSTLALAADGTLPSGSTITLSAASDNLKSAASTTLSTSLPATRTAGESFTIAVQSASGFPAYNGYPVNIGSATLKETFTVLAGAGTGSWLVSPEVSSSAALANSVVFDGDRVYASFDTVEPASGNPQTSTVFLTSSNGTSWTGTVDGTGGFVFSPGRQFVSFGVHRAADGKASTAFSSTAIRLCPAADPACSTLNDPVVDAPNRSAGLGASGALVSPLTVTATTRYLNTGDAVTMSFGTSAGVVSVAMAQDPAAPCPATGSVRTDTECRWTATIRPEDGHRFTTGGQSFYVRARQLLPDNDPATPDHLSTGAAVPTVTFS